MLDNRQHVPLGGGSTGRARFTHTYEGIISIENLLAAWKEFVRGKRKKRDVQEFQHQLISNILSLYRDLKNKTYRHDGYHAFKISDPKPRDIHKANVRDRLVHHALHRKLYPFFDRLFIADSYSCRIEKGTHKAMNRFRSFARRASQDHTRTCWVLKCDIRKFFASVDQKNLMEILSRHVRDTDTLWLVEQVVHSFCSCCPNTLIHLKYATAQYKCMHKGLPLGNLTSQLLVNIYMNEFDQFVKHKLKIKYYIRYADDFVVLSRNKQQLVLICRHMGVFLRDHLKLEMHPDKVFIKTFASGIDFLGWVHFPDHRVLRTSTKRRMLKRVQNPDVPDSSRELYRGMLLHGSAQKLREEIRKYRAANLL